MRISLGIVLVLSMMIVGARQGDAVYANRVLSQEVDRPAMFIPDHAQSNQPQQLPKKPQNAQSPSVSHQQPSLSTVSTQNPADQHSKSIQFHESDQLPQIKFLMGTMAIVPQIKESEYSIVNEIIYPKGNNGEKSRFVASVGGDGFVKKLEEKNKLIVKEVKAEQILKEEDIEQAKKVDQEKKQQAKAKTQQSNHKAQQVNPKASQTKQSTQQNLLSPQQTAKNIPSLEPANTKVHLKQHQLSDPQPITDYKFQQQHKQLQKQQQQQKQRKEREQLEQEKKRKEVQAREVERKKKQEQEYKKKREEEIARNKREEEMRKSKQEEQAKKKEQEEKKRKQEQLRKEHDRKQNEQAKTKKQQAQRNKAQQQKTKTQAERTNNNQQIITDPNPSVTKPSPQQKQWPTSQQITQQFNHLTQLLRIPKTQLQTHLQTQAQTKQKLEQKSTSYRILQLIVWGMIIVAICQAYCGNSQEKKIQRGKYAPVESQLETEDNLQISSGERMQRI